LPRCWSPSFSPTGADRETRAGRLAGISSRSRIGSASPLRRGAAPCSPSRRKSRSPPDSPVASRRRAPGALLASLDLPVAAILILGGLIPGIALFLVAGVFFLLLLAIWRLIRHRRVSRGLRETISRDRRI
jgi:hypothetical protein